MCLRSVLTDYRRIILFKKSPETSTRNTRQAFFRRTSTAEFLFILYVEHSLILLFFQSTSKK